MISLLRLVSLPRCISQGSSDISCLKYGVVLQRVATPVPLGTPSGPDSGGPADAAAGKPTEALGEGTSDGTTRTATVTGVAHSRPLSEYVPVHLWTPAAGAHVRLRNSSQHNVEPGMPHSITMIDPPQAGRSMH